ncbi:MAG TPA: hypothetical protein PK402_03640 [Tepidisphaeraceae bacterium]|nr:hypothetical protein [Tepidisphaeraceae bacterium]
MKLRLATQLIVPLFALFFVGCNDRTTVSNAPVSTAYTDGFQIIVHDLDANEDPANVRCLGLKDAEDAIKSGANAYLVGDISELVTSLPKSKGDSRITLTVTPGDTKRQQVRLAFHDPARTLVCEYVVTADGIIPTSSEYRDVNESKIVRYMAK